MDGRHILAVVAALAAALPLASCGRGSADDPAAQAERAAELIFSADATEAHMNEGFLRALDAIALTAADSKVPAGFPSKIDKARRGIAEGSPTDDRAVALLHECYRDLHEGAPFRFPETILSPADAAREGRQRFESVRTLLQRGESAEAVSRMLEGLLLVVTPIPQQM